MPQLAPRALDGYHATCVHERLAVHRAAAAVGTPPPVDAAQGVRRSARWRAAASLNAEAWRSQRLALEHASEAEWLTLLGEASHAMS
jgi:hypothetical protein